MRHTRNRVVSIVTALAMVVTCFCSFGAVGAFAAEENSAAALSVYDGETLVKEYTLDDLKAIAAKEGNKKYKYSGYNRNPSFYTYGDANAKADVRECWGPTVQGILNDAGVTAEGKQLIKFVAADSATESFTAEDLFAERYYFPNAEGLSDGSEAKEEHYANAEPVVPIIDLHRSESEMESVLRFGQTAPNDQNIAVFIKYVADGGKIIVGDPVTEAWPAITRVNYKSGHVIPGTEIEFDVSAYKNKKVAVYYTLDGTEPTYGDAIYNYNKWGDLNPPDISKAGNYVVKFKVIGSGKLDSPVTTYRYNVKNMSPPAVPSRLAVSASGYDKANIRWSKSKDATGYEVLRCDASSDTFEVVKNVSKNSTIAFTDTSLLTGTTYKYKVRAYKKLSSGQMLYSDTTSVKTVKPSLAKPTITKLTPALKMITVKWKKVNGATGYSIYRSTSKNSGYKCVKTINKGTTLTWKNTKLNRGKKYYYKIKAFRIVKGKKVYSSYSSLKYARAK